MANGIFHYYFQFFANWIEKRMEFVYVSLSWQPQIEINPIKCTTKSQSQHLAAVKIKIQILHKHSTNSEYQTIDKMLSKFVLTTWFNAIHCSEIDEEEGKKTSRIHYWIGKCNRIGLIWFFLSVKCDFNHFMKFRKKIKENNILMFVNSIEYIKTK